MSAPHQGIAPALAISEPADHLVSQHVLKRQSKRGEVVESIAANGVGADEGLEQARKR